MRSAPNPINPLKTMDEFDFDNSQNRPDTDVSSATSSLKSKRTAASPQSTSASSHLRGRTAVRRSGKVTRTGAQALLEAKSTAKNESGRTKSTKKGTKQVVEDGYNSFETPPSAATSLASSASQSKSSKATYGRRHKKRKTSSPSALAWDSVEDFQIGTSASNSVVDKIVTSTKVNAKTTNSSMKSKRGTRTSPTPETPPIAKRVKSSNSRTNSSKGSNSSLKSAKSRKSTTSNTPSSTKSSSSTKTNSSKTSNTVETIQMRTPPTPATPLTSQSRVRFSMSSNTQYQYETPSTLASNDDLEKYQRAEIRSSQSNRNCSGDQCDETSEQQSTHGESKSDDWTTRLISVKNTFMPLPGCRKPSSLPKLRRKTYSQSPAKSNHSATSYGSRRSRKPRRYNRSYSNYYTNSQYSEIGMYTSNSPQKSIALGRRDNIQDAGSYRMMIDDLSYFCSAVLSCRQRQTQHSGQQLEIRHDAITAGSACDLADTISQSDMQSALLVLGRQKNNVGALSAVLEAVACAPLSIGWMGFFGDFNQGKSQVIDVVDKRADVASDKLGLGRRTKSARRKLSVTEECSPNSLSIGVESMKTGGKYDAISSKALSVVAHFVSIICTSKSFTDNLDINTTAIKSARNAVLGHKMALRGLARLILDDPVVSSFLIRDSFDVNGSEVLSSEVVLGDTNMEAQFDEKSSTSRGTEASKLSDNSLTSSNEKFDVELSTTTDPTKFGRRKGRKKKPSHLKDTILSTDSNHKPLESISEVDDDMDGSVENLPGRNQNSATKDMDNKHDYFSFASDDSSRSSRHTLMQKGSNENIDQKDEVKYQEKISSALSRANLCPSLGQANLALDFNDSQDENDWTCPYCITWEQHLLLGSSDFTLTSSRLALDAADRIITGKDKGIEENEDDAEDQSDEDDSDDNFLETNDSEVLKNPILFTNEMMRKSGSLPDYSRSMASTIAALLLLLSEMNDRTCNKCMTYLQHRVSSLSGIIDNLCCLSPEASISLSLPESLLIPSLLQVLTQCHNQTDPLSSFSEELCMIALKTLTTLTHENSSACDQVIAYCQPSDKSNFTNGVEVVFTYLHKTVTQPSIQKSSYDSIIFCLNILTNIAELAPSSTRELLINVLVDEKTKGITWLTQWIVSKTAGFQQDIMKGSFGSTQDEPSHVCNDSELKSGEEDNLVTAGNGFILLAYLMLDEDNGTTTSNVRKIITQELPVDESGTSGGIHFMIKTLKAFCNFYHYFVGDLSVAVIAPVIKLITGLERINSTEQGKKWL